jgi:hypothetical protein
MRKDKGIEHRIACALKPGESVKIVGKGGQVRTITAAGSTSIKPMASTRSINDIAGITDELITGEHSVHRKRIGVDKVRISGMTKGGGRKGSVVLSTAEYLGHVAKEASIGFESGSLLFKDGKAELAEHIK